MSVLTCDRSHCDHIMCNRYSLKWGNLCDSCFEELMISQTTDIEAFLDTVPADLVNTHLDYEYYDAIFPLYPGEEI